MKINMKAFIYQILILSLLGCKLYASDICPSDTIPPYFPDITTFTTDETAPGFIYYTSFVSPYQLAILDQSGAPVYFNDQLTGSYSNFRYQNENLYTFCDQFNHMYIAMDSNYTLIDTFKMSPEYETDFHDIQITSSGNVILMAYDTRLVDMSQIVPGGHPEANVEGLVLQELDPNDNVVFEWQSWDHFEITDGISIGPNPIDFTDAFIPYVHCNSIEIDQDGNWIISSRHMSEVTKINRQTGDIIWRMGGLNNEFTFVNDPFNGFTDQHDARRLENGNLLIFDNGINHDTPTTRVIEYDLDEVNKIATLVWSYENPDGEITQNSGTAQRLDNGNTFIFWGRRANIQPTPTNLAVEVNQQGNTVFELFFNIPAQIGFVYRMFKLPWNAPDLLTSIAKVYPLEAQVYLFPNPADEVATFQFQVPESQDYQFIILDASGKLVSQESLSLLSENRNQHSLETLHLPAGIYYYYLSLSGKISSGSFLVHH
jgi:hypothetical protein